MSLLVPNSLIPFSSNSILALLGSEGFVKIKQNSFRKEKKKVQTHSKIKIQKKNKILIFFICILASSMSQI